MPAIREGKQFRCKECGNAVRVPKRRRPKSVQPSEENPFEDFEDYPDDEVVDSKEALAASFPLTRGRIQRAYEHVKCGQQTVVSEDDFKGLCDPLDLATHTYCVSCGDMFGIEEYVWADTEERLDKYRERLHKIIPESMLRLHDRIRFLCFAMAFVLAGAAAYFLPGIVWKIGGAVGGFIGGFMIVGIPGAKLFAVRNKIKFHEFD